ncbi:LacI family DNA-binding transcriptional regulator [Paenibacillus tritici]|uniref:LacI family DNA-binding transcriptional regulator n=1 Tax=Paenibacillus tritici TaxID=1873425 RepID=UPI001BA62D73|nr:LacI family DNA-binding transcriptional regulator [Paenibacillus tritici]QUL53133.1 LacI family DNA-binding transcriptional regulator [Paenibacillus tritici]
MGKKRVTSFDVAKRAGVSRSVVSAVLNNTPGIGVGADTREAVLEAIRELNYHVDAGARSMKTGRSMTLAAYGDTRHPLFTRLLEGMQRECEQSGYHILLCSPRHKGNAEGRAELLELYHRRKIDGIVTLDHTSYQDEEWASRINSAGIPYVSVEGYAEVPGVYSVLADYSGSVETALNYLMREGTPQHLGPVYAEVYHELEEDNWAERNRREAYTGWCSAHGFEPLVIRLEEHGDGWTECLQRLAPDGGQGLARDSRQGLVRDSRQKLVRDSHRELERDSRQELERDTRQPYAPLLVNWSSAIPDLYRAAHKLGLRIGEDLRLMAADNTIQGHRLSLPSLSCVEIPYVSMGEEAVRCLHTQMNGGSERVQVDGGSERVQVDGSSERVQVDRDGARVQVDWDGAKEQVDKIWLPAVLRAGESA